MGMINCLSIIIHFTSATSWYAHMIDSPLLRVLTLFCYFVYQMGSKNHCSRYIARYKKLYIFNDLPTWKTEVFEMLTIFCFYYHHLRRKQQEICGHMTGQLPRLERFDLGREKLCSFWDFEALESSFCIVSYPMVLLLVLLLRISCCLDSWFPR